MTISTTTRTVTHNGNGVAVNFTYPFKIADQVDLLVYVKSGSVFVLKSLGTDYTVSGVGSPSGGTVSFTAAPAVGTGNVRFLRRTALTQLVDYITNDDFPAEIHEAALDKLTMAVQDYLGDSMTLDATADFWDAESKVIKNVADPVDPQDAATLAYGEANWGGAASDSAAASAAAAASSASTASTDATAAAGSATAAAASAAAASAAVEAVMWNDVVFKTYADSPITISDVDAGKLIAIDTSGGNIVVNLPSISGLTLSKPWSIGFKKTTGDANTVTINRNGTDVIDGSTSLTISAANGRVLIPDTDPTPDAWTSMQFGADALADGSVTPSKLAANAVTQDKVASGVAGTGPAFRAYATGATSITSSYNKVALAGEDFDTANAFDSTTNFRFQPNVAGYYHISWSCYFSTGSYAVTTQLRKNGTACSAGGPEVASRWSAGSDIVYLNGSTDYLELFAYSATTQNNTATQAGTFMSGALVRKA